ncbi:MAG: Ig-like domain-containing protein, partial [Thermotogae bacterium]|nr:Ig-like domain-containing protein [Thermotogota bacterium]
VKANEFATVTVQITGNPTLTRTAESVAAGVTMPQIANTITFVGTGTVNDKCLVQGTKITVTAPPGMKWVQQANGANTGDTVDLTTAAFSIAGAAGLTPASTLSCTGGAATALVTPADISLTTDDYGNVTAFSILLSSGSLNGGDTFQITFDTTAATDISLAPITSGNPPLINSKTLKIGVSCNNGAQTAEVGDIRVLKVPKLVSALATTDRSFDAYFDVDVDQTTITTGVGLAITPGAGGSDFVVSTGGTADIAVDPSNKKKVSFTNLTPPITLDGTTTINVDFANDFVNNDLGAIPGAANADLNNDGLIDQNHAIPIMAAGVGVSDVSVNKTVVGANSTPAVSYAACLKPDNTNKITVTFTATGGQPFYFRIVDAANEEVVLPGEMGTGYWCSNAAVAATIDPNYVYTVPAAVNTSGIVQLDLCFNNLALPKFLAGKKRAIRIQASTDYFTTKVESSDIMLDREAPAIVLSGDNKAKALSRTSVQLQFNEEMDRTACERLFVDNGAGGGVANDGLQNGAEPSIYILQDTTTAAPIRVKSVTLGADNKTVTLTTDLIPVGHNLQIRVLGSAAAGTDGTNREGAMDKAGNYVAYTPAANVYVNSNTFIVTGEELTSCTATNQATRRNFIADGGTLRTEVTGPANLGAVNIRAVDADNKTMILSTVASAAANEVSPGLYRNTTMTLTTGITARAVIVQASTDITFSTGVVESNEVVVDNTKPKVVSAAWVDDNHCTVTFDEPVLIGDAEDGGNYTIPGLQVSTVATLDLTTEKTVTLTTTTMTPGTTYTVDVAAAVRDLAGNGINSSANAIGIDRASFIAGVGPFSVSPDTVTVAAGATIEATATGGTSPYTVTSSDETVATATIS